MKDIWEGIILILNSGLIWKILFFSCAVYVVLIIRKLQRVTGNNIDFFEVIRDNVTGKFSHVRIAYMVVLVATTYAYILACTRTSTSVNEISTFTLVYAGLWVGSQAANKFSERPPAPVIQQQSPNPNPIIQNQGDVNVGKQE